MHGVKNPVVKRSGLERPAVGSNSLVAENNWTPDRIPSSTGHEKSRVNPGGPPPKAKYSLATDSEQVP